MNMITNSMKGSREEMARLAKSEEKTPTKPKVNDDDDVYFGEEHEAYFDDPTPQSVTVTA